MALVGGGLLAIEPVGLRSDAGVWSWDDIRERDQIVFFDNNRTELGKILDIDYDREEINWQQDLGNRLGVISKIPFNRIKHVTRSRSRSAIIDHNFGVLLSSQDSQAAADLVRGLREVLDWVSDDLSGQSEQLTSVLAAVRPLAVRAVRQFPKDPSLTVESKRGDGLCTS